MVNRILLLFIIAACSISVSSYVRETPATKNKKVINTVEKTWVREGSTPMKKTSVLPFR